jgi:hydrogenase-4 component E
VGTWRTSLLGLAMQGVLMAAIVVRHGAYLSLDSALALFDLVALRTIAAPLLVYQVLRAQNAPPRNDVIAPNLISWGLALGLVVVAFRMADTLVPAEGDEQALVAIASSSFVLGMFVLSTGRGTVSQIIGLLRVENAIALFELGGDPHHEALGIRVGQTVLMLVSIAFCRGYLVRLGRDEREDQPPSLHKQVEL